MSFGAEKQVAAASGKSFACRHVGWGRWLIAFLTHVAFCFLWVMGGLVVAVTTALLAGFTYGISFTIFGSVAIKKRGLQQAWAATILVLCACLGPRSADERGFARFWISFAWLVFSSYIAWFKDFAPRMGFRKFVHGLQAPNFYRACEWRGLLGDVKEQKSLFAWHPHGIQAVGFSMNGVWNEQFHKHAGYDTVHLCDKVLRQDNPYFKVVADVHGRIETLNKDSLQRYMKAGSNVSFVPGGFEEATALSFGEHRVVMKQRTGFIKYALQHGYRVHPIYTFGEEETYHCFTGLVKFRMWLNKYGIPAVAFFGFPLIPIIPRPQARIMTCIGKAIELPRIAEPTQEEVAKWHATYLAALTDVFDSHKEAYGLPKSAKLEIW